MKKSDTNIEPILSAVPARWLQPPSGGPVYLPPPERILRGQRRFQQLLGSPSFSAQDVLSRLANQDESKLQREQRQPTHAPAHQEIQSFRLGSWPRSCFRRLRHRMKRLAFCLWVVASVSVLIQEPLSSDTNHSLAGAFGVID